MHRMYFIAMLSVALASCPWSFSHASADDLSAPNNVYDDYFLLLGGSELSPDIVKIAASSLQPRWPDFKGPADAAAIGAWIEYGGADIGGARLMSLYISVSKDYRDVGENDMRQLWDIARRQLQAELQRMAEMGYEVQYTRLEQDLDRQQAQRKAIEQEAANLASASAEIEAEIAGYDRDTLAKAIVEAVGNSRGLELEEAGNNAHRQAIEDRIDELRQRSAQLGDPIVDELEKIVKIRQQSLERSVALIEAGQSSPGENSEAEAQLAEAQIELHRAQRDAEDRSSGGALRVLTKELSLLMVQSAKISGQRAQLEKTIAELRKQVTATGQATADIARVRDRMQLADHRRGQIDNRIHQLRDSQAQLIEPEILLEPVLSGHEGATAEPASAASPDQPVDAAEPTSDDK